LGMQALAAVGAVFAVLTISYTGLLLSSSKGMPFWRSGVVPALFVISALVTGHFLIMLGMTLVNQGAQTIAQLDIMAIEAIALVAVELLAIWFFLLAAYKQPDSRESAERILRKRLFVVGYFVLGLGLPLVLMLALHFGMSESERGTIIGTALVGALFGLAGGLVLRQSVLACGALPTLNIGGFQFRRIARPKDPKPEMGLMPPK